MVFTVDDCYNQGDFKRKERLLMNKSECTIGITGHRYLPTHSLSKLTESIKEYYREKADEYGLANVTVLSAVAEGADTLGARLALDEGLRLVIPLPMAAIDYRKDFSGLSVIEFDRLLTLADEVFVVLPSEQLPNEKSRGFSYRQAGLYIVKQCDVLLAVWDGAKGDTLDGAGTWETVKLAQEAGKPIHVVAI